MYLSTREVTAVLPSYGPVTWAPDTVDNYAREFLMEHRPHGVSWRLPLFSSEDHRQCTGCKPGLLWQECAFALWARSWQAERKLTGWKRPAVPEFLAADTVPNVVAPA